MKIQTISPVSFKNNYQNDKKETQYQGYIPPKDEFVPQSERVQKNTFLDKILNLFTSKNAKLTPEEEKNEQIDYYIYQVSQNSKLLNQLGKIHFSITKNSLLIGLEENFRLYCDFDPKRKIKLIFGDVDSETNVPASMAHIDMNNGMKAIREYEFFDGLHSYMIKDKTVENIESELLMMGNELVSVKETDLSENKVRRFVKTREGFYYVEALLDDKNNVSQVEKIVSSDKKELLNNQYIEYNKEDGCYDIYAINEQTGLWEKVGYADSVEAE